jgi:Zn-dependent protease
MLAYINVFLGLFNMIPVLPFDGSKIVRWNIPIYIMAAAIGAAEFLVVRLYLF